MSNDRTLTPGTKAIPTSNTCAYWADGPQWPLTSEVVHVPMQPEDNGRRIPMEISAEAWKEYAAQGHGDQSHQRMIQRGGFGSVELAILLFQRIKRLEGNRPHGHETAASLTPIEQLLVQWWGSEMDNGELFNRAVRLSEPLAKAMMELPERAAQETRDDDPARWLLRWLNNRGGLGLEKHGLIEAVIEGRAYVRNDQLYTDGPTPTVGLRDIRET